MVDTQTQEGAQNPEEQNPAGADTAHQPGTEKSDPPAKGTRDKGSKPAEKKDKASKSAETEEPEGKKPKGPQLPEGYEGNVKQFLADVEATPERERTEEQRKLYGHFSKQK